MNANFIINPDDKFYPEADDDIWNHCTFLGKFTDSKGKNYDLGVYLDDCSGETCDATVHSNEKGDHSSAELNAYTMKNETREWKKEVYRRAKILNLIKQF